MTQQLETQQQPSKLEVLRALYLNYVPSPDPAAKPQAMADAVKATADYQRFFAQEKDPERAAQRMRMKSRAADVPAWLVDGAHEKVYQGKSEGKGALFLMPDRKTRFVNLGAYLDPPGALLDNYVFPEGTLVHDVVTGEDSYSLKPGAKPVPRKHGIDPPNTDLSAELAKAARFNEKRGCITGESFDPVLAVLTITEDENEIRYYQASDRGAAALHYRANDAGGNVYIVKDDVQAACQKTGLTETTPDKVWKTTLAGQPIVAMATLRLFIDRVDGDFWGGKGTLAKIAADYAPCMVENPKKPGHFHLDFTKLEKRVKTDAAGQPVIDPKTGQPEMAYVDCLPAGKKWLYRLESRPDEKNPGSTVHTGWARADQELDRNQQPTPPTLDAVVKTGVKNGKPWTMNEGAFVTYLNYTVGKPVPKTSPFQGVFDFA